MIEGKNNSCPFCGASEEKYLEGCCEDSKLAQEIDEIEVPEI